MSTPNLKASDLARSSMVVSIAYLILSNLLLWNNATFFVIVLYVIPVALILLSNLRKRPLATSYQFSYILISGIGVWNHDFGVIIFAFALFLIGRFIPAFR